MTIDITDQSRRIQYTGSGTGPYPFDFEVLEETDIAVYRDTTLLALTTNYTVTVNSDGTGSVTTTSSMSGYTVTISGARPYERITDFSTGGDFFASNVNDEFDSQQIQILQLREVDNRTLQAPVTDDPSLDMSLPSSASRLGKYLAFDANGEPTASAGTGNDSALRTDLTATNGASLVNYLQSGTGAVARTVQARLRDWVSVKDFGALGDDANDDTAEIQAALDSLATNGGTCFFPHGTYRHTGITWPPNVDMLGESSGHVGKTRLKSTSAAIALSCTPGSETEINGSIKNLVLDGNSVGTIGLKVQDIARFTLERVTIINFTQKGFYSVDSLVYELNDCIFYTCVIGVDIAGNADGGSYANLIGVKRCLFVGNTTYGLQYSGGSQLTLDTNDFEFNGTSGNANTGGVKVSGLTPFGEGVGVISTNNMFEETSGHSAIRINAPAAAPCHNTFRSDEILASGTRTYGVFFDAGASVMTNLLQGVVSVGAVTADFYESATNVQSTYIRCVGTTKSFNATGDVTVMLPDPVSAGVNSIGSSTTFNFNSQLQLDKDATATNTRMLVWDVTAGALRRVSIGANDSGGAGFRVLRIPN
jgi:hypothetical protein